MKTTTSMKTAITSETSEHRINIKQNCNLTDLNTLLELCSNGQLLAIIEERIESDPIDYQEMSKEELIAFIKENYNYAIIADVYKDEDEFIDWCFNIALKHKTLEMSERFNKQQIANNKDADGYLQAYDVLLLFSLCYIIFH